MREKLDKQALVKIIISFGLILIGGFFYCNLKTGTIINELFDDFFLIRKQKHDSLFLFFMFNWGCDLIWASSFYLMLSAFCKHKYSFVLTLIFSIIYELSQRFICRLGTFDIIDLIVQTLCIVTLFIFFKKVRKEA